MQEPKSKFKQTIKHPTAHQVYWIFETLTEIGMLIVSIGMGAYLMSRGTYGQTTIYAGGIFAVINYLINQCHSKRTDQI